STIALGPPGTVARIIAFSPAVTSTTPGAGVRYFYIAKSDVSSGVSETSTVINDNTTTSATFNFDDTYLQSSTEVTAFFNKAQIPPCVDIYYSRGQERLFYSGVKGYPSGFWASVANDPESVYANNGINQVGEQDGQRLICIREYAGITYALKERSGYVVG